MSSLPSNVDVAIIGAGAAGLGAANALKDSGLAVIVLEARERVGGRAHTIKAAPDVIFDVGCGWLHSANENTFVPIAERLGFGLRGGGHDTAGQGERSERDSENLGLDRYFKLHPG